jgi:hypothetical protein
MRTILWSLLALVLLAGSPTPGAAQERNTAGLEVVSITAKSFWMIHYEWNIAHSAEPSSWQLFRGDRGRSLFTITAERSSGYRSAWIQGEVCVFNHLSDNTLTPVVMVRLHSAGAVISATEARNERQAVLPPGQESCLRYRLEIPENHINPGGNYAVFADASAQDPSGVALNSGRSISVRFRDEPETSSEQIQVMVPGSGTWTLTGSDRVQYEQTFSCDAAQGVQTRTAVIAGSEQSARAEVNISCYELEVWPVIQTAHNRVYRWSLDVNSEVEKLTLLAGETAPVEYRVKVENQGYTDLYFRAHGSIQVRNPAPFSVELSDITAVLSRGNKINIDCSSLKFPLVLASGETVSCRFSAIPAEGERITASAERFNTNYHYRLDAKRAGTTAFQSQPRPISYRSPHTVHESLACVDIGTDTNGERHRVCRSEEAPVMLTYTRQVGPYDQCGTFTVSEQLKILSSGLLDPGVGRWQVIVEVPCDLGCTRLPSYWATYSGLRTDRYDPAWDNFKNVLFYRSNINWERMLHTSSASNPYYLLARQYIAARLNVAGGAKASQEVQAAIKNAETLFQAYAPHQIARAKTSLQREIQSLAMDLDHFNRGLTGPGACSRLPSGGNR